MAVALVTHESVTQHRSWAIDEIHRVLDKVSLSPIMVRLDPGFALDAVESLGYRYDDVIVVPAQANWLPLFEAYKRADAERRMHHLLADHTAIDVTFLPLSDGQRVGFAERDAWLAATCDTHVCVYDGRDRGSVVRYLQLVMGIQPTIIIDPATQTTRLLAPKGAPCTSTSPSTSTVPSTS